MVMALPVVSSSRDLCKTRFSGLKLAQPECVYTGLCLGSAGDCCEESESDRVHSLPEGLVSYLWLKGLYWNEC